VTEERWLGDQISPTSQPTPRRREALLPSSHTDLPHHTHTPPTPTSHRHRASPSRLRHGRRHNTTHNATRPLSLVPSSISSPGTGYPLGADWRKRAGAPSKPSATQFHPKLLIPPTFHPDGVQTIVATGPGHSALERVGRRQIATRLGPSIWTPVMRPLCSRAVATTRDSTTWRKSTTGHHISFPDGATRHRRKNWRRRCFLRVYAPGKLPRGSQVHHLLYRIATNSGKTTPAIHAMRGRAEVY